MANSIFLTSYFSKKIHPNSPDDKAVIGRQKNGKVLDNSIEYIKPWYNSINDLKLNGIVFYDNLTEDFIKKYQTNYTKFVKTDISQYSNNDWRFFVYRNFLKKNHYDNVFLTDGSDVTIVSDPNNIIQKYEYIDYFICKDNILLSQFPYIKLHSQVKWENISWFMKMQHILPLINMGVIGGSYTNIVEFLEIFCQQRIKLGSPEFNSDMWLGQYIFRYMLSHKNLLIGEPFTSEFKKYQNERKDVYFIHK